MSDERQSGVPPIDGGKIAYEAPALVPVGNLYDLLAGGGSQGCDNGCLGDPGTTVVPNPMCSPGNC
jgi:hypothetical protein